MIRWAVLLVLFAQPAAPKPTVKVEKPKPVAASGGSCRMKDEGTLGVNIGPNLTMPTLAFTIGPGAAMAAEMHANLGKFTGPGTYVNELIALYLGKTPLEDSYMGLGTITIGPDGKSGTFALNDRSASGTFDCGGPPEKPR